MSTQFHISFCIHEAHMFGYYWPDPLPDVLPFKSNLLVQNDTKSTLSPACFRGTKKPVAQFSHKFDRSQDGGGSPIYMFCSRFRRSCERDRSSLLCKSSLRTHRIIGLFLKPITHRRTTQQGWVTILSISVYSQG